MDEITLKHDETCLCDGCKLMRNRVKHAAYMREYSKRRRAQDPEYRERTNARNRMCRKRLHEENPNLYRDYCRKWRTNNHERANELSRQWAERNLAYVQGKSAARPRVAQMTTEQREAANAKKRADYYRHREERLAAGKVRRDANPGGESKWRAAKNSRRRARLAQAEGKWTAAEFETVCLFYQHHCYYCGRVFEKLTADHRVPLARGGSNDISNIVPACRPCNTSKSTKTDTEFFAWVEARKQS